MCDVHLIEIRREHIDHWIGACSCCSDKIDGECDVVLGRLDDGTPGIQVLRYHPECLDGIELEGHDENEGCFTYGEVSEVLKD